MKTGFDFFGKRINIASRTRRRWLLVLIYAQFIGLVIAWFSVYGRSSDSFLIILAFLLLANILGGRSYKRGVVPPFTGGDERERYRRYYAHYVAYKYWDLTLIPALVAVAVRSLPFNPAWHPALQVFLNRLPYGLLVASAIVYFTLPQAVLFWTEGDMEHE